MLYWGDLDRVKVLFECGSITPENVIANPHLMKEASNKPDSVQFLKDFTPGHVWVDTTPGPQLSLYKKLEFWVSGMPVVRMKLPRSAIT
jgi:hypothetical protein